MHFGSPQLYFVLIQAYFHGFLLNRFPIKQINFKFFVTGGSYENRYHQLSDEVKTMEGNSKDNPLWLPVKEATCQRPTKEQEVEVS